MKYYFFRDYDNEKNLLNDKTHNAAGYVEKIFCELDKPNESGKDLSVIFFHPFEATIEREWRAMNEVELFEVERHEYNAAMYSYTAIENLK